MRRSLKGKNEHEAPIQLEHLLFYSLSTAGSRATVVRTFLFQCDFGTKRDTDATAKTDVMSHVARGIAFTLGFLNAQYMTMMTQTCRQINAASPQAAKALPSMTL